MEPKTARDDLSFIKQVLDRTHRLIDPHAFHYVHWGAIVLIWYPLANLFVDLGRQGLVLPLSIAAVTLGMGLSTFREIRLARRPRLEGQNTFVGRQVVCILVVSLGAGGVLSGLAPATGFIEGPDVPIIWGLAYANMAFMIGVIYNRDFLVAGAFIFLGCVAAMLFQAQCGYILGPVMGLGLIVPGILAERRVRRLQEENGGRAN
ncbi:MAG: hypothetical protein JXA57_18530 [Armatimonadetes bacterium]|nr:hypothetical protein [Armatimonadota bacterium]